MQDEEIRICDSKIVRSEDPPNLEMPFEQLDGFVTPTEMFYVRTHFPIPEIDRAKWGLQIEGEVEKPFTLTYDELLKLESRTMPVTLECAGNNRIFLEPKVKGVQWGLGAVGNAEWSGIPLSSLLARAGIKSNALEVILEGADQGELEDPKSPRGEVAFARSVPIAKAQQDVMLAYKMNGEELLPQHGFPLRAIVPGWYAMASIKWLQRVIVTDQPFNGYYQTLDYAYWAQRNGLPELRPLSAMQLKAEIAQPAPGQTVPLNSDVNIRGAAWTGEGTIARVEVSSDAGANWSEANLIGPAAPHAWRLWEFQWRTPSKPGRQTLVARATDSSGQIQPVERGPGRGTYMINHLLPIEVEVR